MALQTRRTGIAARADPLDTYTIAHLHCRTLGARPHLHDLADALVSADLAFLCGRGQREPRVCHDAEVGVADA